jgi:hypothetical protein
MYGRHIGGECLFVKASMLFTSKKMLAYYELCQYSVNYKLVLIYSTGPGSLYGEEWISLGK